MAKNRARIVSPRSVLTMYREMLSSNVMAVMPVEKSALSYKLNVVAIRFACA